MVADAPSHIEIKILGRTCYVTQEDLRIFYGIAGSLTGKHKPFADLPENAFIVQVIWKRKKAIHIERSKQREAAARKMLGGD